jgi:hypothetical protein
VSDALQSRLDALCAEGWAIWEQFERDVRDREFHAFVAADYDAVRTALTEIPAAGRRFLELGSATGVIAIMADVLGFEAYGIELDAGLVSTARALALRHASRAQFVVGSYLPSGFRPRARGPATRRNLQTTGDGPSGYLQLGRALDEFDVVFGYPWSGEANVMQDLMRQFGAPDAELMLFDVLEGVQRFRGGKRC